MGEFSFTLLMPHLQDLVCEVKRDKKESMFYTSSLQPDVYKVLHN
jgi:hypothetical protein